MLFLIVVIISSSVIVFLSFTNAHSSPAIPFKSSITPFNITTTLSWDPFSFGNDFNYRMSYLTVSSKDGLEIPFYATQLPLFQRYNNISYSIQVLKFDRPSNISIALTGSQVIYTAFNGTKSVNKIPEEVFLNPVDNNSFSGVLQVKQNTFNYEKYLFPNSSSAFEYEFNLFYIQPKTVNYSIWNHYLTLRISLSGLEDRPLFNYFRQLHGYPVWSADDFQPLNIGQIDSILTKKTFFFAPVSNVDGFSNPYKLIYADNRSFLSNDFLHLKINLETTNPIKLGIHFGRELIVTYDGTYIALNTILSRSISYFPLYNDSSIDILLNWQEINFINTTIRGITTNQSNGTISIYTSGKMFQENPIVHQTDGHNQTVANYTINFVSLSVENPSNNSQWINWGSLTSDISWNPTNTSLSPDTILMYGNNGLNNFSNKFSLNSSTSSNQLSFLTDFFVATIIFVSGRKFFKKRNALKE